MIGRCILLYLTLRTISSENTNVPPQARELNRLSWQLPSNILQSHRENNLQPATPRSGDVLLIWSSSDTNLKVPKFLVSQDEVSMWAENDKFPPRENNPVTEGPKTVDNIESLLPQNVEPNHFEQKKPEDEVVKQKIFSLAKDTAKDLDAKVAIIEKTNAMFKHNNYYKLGFIVSYINTTHNALTDLMTYVDRNKEEWDVLKILNSYVQIKKTKEFLIEMVSILNYLQSRSTLSVQTSQGDKKKEKHGIAWSYYDDA